MSYDIMLKDPVTGKTIEINEPHFMRGGTYQVGGSKELWLNITYNYSDYYYEATEGDPRFAHDEVTEYYFDGTEGPVETRYGIRGIYGKTGSDSIPMLEDMIGRIEMKYKKNGEWITGKRKVTRYYDDKGECDLTLAIMDSRKYREETKEEDWYEGPDSDYWKDTAANAIRPLLQLIAMAKMRPDGIWDGD